MQVESKSLTKRFLIFILRLLINTVLPLISTTANDPFKNGNQLLILTSRKGTTEINRQIFVLEIN